MTLPPLTFIIGRALGYLIVLALLPALLLGYVIGGVAAGAVWIWSGGRGEWRRGGGGY